MTAPPIEAPRRFIWPADYYSSATPEPILPRWASLGCGGASVVLLLVIFGGGIFLSTGGFTQFLDLALGMSVGEMKGMYEDDVTSERRASLDSEIERVREGIRNESISVASIQPLLEKMRDVTSDRKVTAEEAAELEQLARTLGPSSP